MKCPHCGEHKPAYHFFKQRSHFETTKLSFYTRPIEAVANLCFACAGPYHCLQCHHEQAADQFRVGGRICLTCKAARFVPVQGQNRTY